MPRKVAFSAKQKRQQLQDKRALKRGEIEIDDFRITNKKYTHIDKSSGRTSVVRKGGLGLYSRFTALGPEYVEETRNLAWSTPLPRPLELGTSKWDQSVMERDDGRLSCPSRPKFKMGQGKKEVERNEEGLFKKWLKGTEDVMREWVEAGPSKPAAHPREGAVDEEIEEEEKDKWPRSPSWFETNIEVWRQLWRVSEVSQILLVLLDSRCPPLHYPPSLQRYIAGLRPKKEVILVLTKSDLVDPSTLNGWKAWCKQAYGPDVGIVTAKSYNTEILQVSGRHRPDIPQANLEELVAAIREAHARLQKPPEINNVAGNVARTWTPAMRKDIDWDLLTHGAAMLDDQEPSSPADTPAPTEPAVRDPASEPLVLGLLGQPNVGKSSLLNALMGEVRARASKTPGKTKHFQTMFWGWKKHVKIVDCPGLVCPSLVGMELQAMAGILPISQIPSLPACIYHSSLLLPLETILRLPAPPPSSLDPYAHKKTWRTAKPEIEDSREIWTAGYIMEARAIDRGYVTAKSARPDTNRASNGMMRMLAEGKIRWGFVAPDTEVEERKWGMGVWLGEVSDLELGDADGHGRSDEDDGGEWELSSVDGDYEDHRFGALNSGANGEADDSGDESEGGGAQGARSGGTGFFAALDLEESDDDDESEDSSEAEAGDVERPAERAKE